MTTTHIMEAQLAALLDAAEAMLASQMEHLLHKATREDPAEHVLSYEKACAEDLEAACKSARLTLGYLIATAR
jgi:hypothetical protein